MGTAYVLVTLVGGGFLLHALANLSNPQARGSTGSIPLRAEAAPSWPSREGGEGRPRVLMVGRSSKHGRRTEDLLRRAGYEVRACAGPEGSLETFPYGGCGLLNEGQCSLSAGADAIVFGLELDTGAARGVLRGYRTTLPGIPLFVYTSEREAQWYERELRDCEVTTGGSEEELVEVVERALAVRRQGGGS